MSDENNFKPTLEGYKPLRPFNLFMKNNFPFIENTFEALDTYGLLCKVVEYLNDVISNENIVEENVQELYNAFSQLNDYVSHYFDNLDVQEEINNKLDELVLDGTMSTLLQPIFEEYAEEITTMVTDQGAEINVIKQRMDSFSTLTDGSTSGDAELIDGRINYDGSYVYNNIGDAIRGQINEVWDSVSKKSTNIYRGLFEVHSNINNTTGEYIVSDTYENTSANKGYIPVNASSVYYLQARNNDVASATVYAFYYNSSKEIISYTSTSITFDFITPVKITTPANTKYLRIKFSQSGEYIALSQSYDISIRSDENYKKNPSFYYKPHEINILKENIPDNSIDIPKTENIFENTYNIYKGNYFPHSTLTLNGTFMYDKTGTTYLNTSANNEYMSVLAGETYMYRFLTTFATIRVDVFYYDSNFDYVDTDGASKNASNNVIQLEFIVPSGVSYVRFKLTLNGETEALAQTKNHFLVHVENSIIKPYINNYKIKKELENEKFEYYKQLTEQLILKNKILLTLENSDDLFTFGWQSDSHYYPENESGLIDTDTLNILQKQKFVDCIVHTGDLINDYKIGTSGTGITLEEYIERINLYTEKIDKILPTIITRGNHDLNSHSAGIASKILFENLVQKNFCNNRNIFNHTSFYRDFNDKNIRVINIDIYQNDTNVTFSEELVQWICETALNTDKSILVCCHYLGETTLVNLFNAYKNGGTYTYENYSHTFNENGKLIAVISGHSHGESDSNENGFVEIAINTSYNKYNMIPTYNIYASLIGIDTTNKLLYKISIGNNNHSFIYNYDTLEKSSFE